MKNSQANYGVNEAAVKSIIEVTNLLKQEIENHV
jgi:hypothetical protein